MSIESLYESLVEKQILKPEMELEIKYKGIDPFGLKVDCIDFFTIETIYRNQKDRELYFKVYSNKDGRRIMITSDQILNIEGQTPERFAASFELNELGEKIEYRNPDGSLKRRPGRPKKHR